MRLKNIISKDLIISKLKAQNNGEAILELVELLAKRGKISGEFLMEAQLALFKREALGSTGVGGGLAIPHGRLPFIFDVVGALGIAKKGLDFRSADGHPVQVIFLFLSPSHDPKLHLKMMSLVSGLSKCPSFIHALKEAEAIDEIHSLIERAEAMVFSENKKWDGGLEI